MMPSLFLAHGSPMLAIEDSPYAGFLAELGRTLRPKAIVIFSAHWESPVTTVSSTDGTYDTIYDFGGFPPELYRIKYPARGSTAVAAKVTERLKKAGIPVRTDGARGLDHGSWTMLLRMYPDADIPVVQASVHPFLPGEEQLRIGEALAGFGAEDILVIGSGVTVHNFAEIRRGGGAPEPWAVEFDDWLIERIAANDRASLARYMELAPHARRAVPRPEHFVPFLIAAGAGTGKAKVLHRHYDYGTLSYLCMSF
mgnify:FL=1